MNYHIKNFILPLHLIGLFMIVWMYAAGVSISWPLFFLGWTAIYGLGLVVGFHKLLSHRAFTTNRYATYALTYLGCLGVSGSPIWWSAIHRGHHHAHTETEVDLQTPRKGFWNSYIGWQFGEETSKISLKYAKDLMKDPVFVWFHKNYREVVWGTVLAVYFIFGFEVTASLLIFPMLAAHHGENITNALGHSRFAGYRNYETTDDTINNPLLAFLTWGQLLHNNHHAKPNDESFSKKWWEIDPTMPFVWLLKKLPK